MTPEEVAAAAAYLKDTIGKEGVKSSSATFLKIKVRSPMTSTCYFIVASGQFSYLSDNFLLAQKERSLSKTL